MPVLRKKLLSALRMTVLLVALAPLISITYATLVGAAPGQVLNSDLVQPFMVMRDVLIEPSSIMSWHLSPAIYLFPDYLIALFINLFDVSPVSTIVASGTMLGILMVFAGGYLFRSAGWPNLEGACVASAFAVTSAVLIGYLLPGTLATLLQAWTFTLFVHSGSLFSGVLLIGLWTNVEFVRPLRRRLFTVSLVLTAFASYSDLSFLAYFVVPTIVATMVSWFLHPESGRLKRVVILAGVAIAAYSLDRLTREYRGLEVSFSIGDNIAVWLALVWPNLPGNPLLAFYVFVTPVMMLRAFFLIIHALRSRKIAAADFIEITLAGTQSLSILVPALFDGHDDIANLRYSLPIALVPVFWILILTRAWLSRAMQVRQYAFLAAGVWLVILLVSLWPRLGAVTAVAAEAPVVTCMRQLKLEAAYSDYWNAKGPVFQSNYRIHIVHLASNGRRYDFNTNERWLSHSIVDGAPVSIKAIVMQRLDAAEVEQIYGSPSEIEICLGMTFWLYDEALPIPPR